MGLTYDPTRHIIIASGGFDTLCTNVEPEINGLITDDRKIHNPSASELDAIVNASGLIEQ